MGYKFHRIQSAFHLGGDPAAGSLTGVAVDAVAGLFNPVIAGQIGRAGGRAA
jgi:hypothetical protein